MFPIAAVYTEKWSDAIECEVRNAVVIGMERTSEQDLEFPIDQLTEIAVRALSPSLDDPFTAILCVKRLSASLAPLFAREWPEPFVCATTGAPVITLLRTTPERVLRRAFDARAGPRRRYADHVDHAEDECAAGAERLLYVSRARAHG